MKNALLFSLSGLLTIMPAGCVFADSTNGTPPAEILSSYRCPFSSTPIAVDGEFKEPVWDKAKTITFVIPESFKEPISKTEAKIAYDKDYLYVVLKGYDKDIWAMLAERDSATCTEDVLEIFFKTASDKDPYFNFEINALGTVYDAYDAKRGAAGNNKRWSQWNCNGLKVAVKINGTLDNWTDQDEYWILEAAIPFAELPTLNGKAPVKGDQWLFNLARYDYSVYLPEGRELSSSSPLTKVNFHRYEDWRRLVFD